MCKPGACAKSTSISSGYSDRKDATWNFNAHASTSTHKLAFEVMIKQPKTTGNVGEMLSSPFQRRSMLIVRIYSRLQLHRVFNSWQDRPFLYVEMEVMAILHS